jgi:uncharacterized protein (TIGR00296 family)
MLVSFQLSPEEGKFLINLARKAVKVYLKNRKSIKVPETASEKLLQHCGVFVTINSLKHGQKKLRGCIGYPYPTTPLAQAVIETAVSSATQDPRFTPLSASELDHVVFEVSVLTPPNQIKVEKPSEYAGKIKIGEDGLIIERGVFKGLLLPQVPVEWKWDEEEFLCQCCVKAGLPPDCWLMEGAKIYSFQALVFEEEEPRGKTKRKPLSGR